MYLFYIECTNILGFIMSHYITRPISRKILSCSSKVVVLEGARAVGKTQLMRQEIESKGYTYYSLADSTTLHLAQDDLGGWVKSLPSKTIIDEAQRIKDLPLAIKERVDSSDDECPQFILTGSAMINRNGLDGQNPLTRRAQSYTLLPLTMSEITSQKSNIVDQLFDFNPNIGFKNGLSQKDAMTFMSIGGFPDYAVTTKILSERERNLRISSDIDNVLNDSVLPDEILDVGIAKKVLQPLLLAPGNIVNVQKLSKDIERDKRTVGRYLDILARRFLIYPLSNLKVSPRKQSFSRTKIHPVDTSFSAMQFKEVGIELDNDPMRFGWLFESFVVNQLIASAQWSDYQPASFYWRDSSNNSKEVDLVLLSGSRCIGIEIKSAESVAKSDFDGLYALNKDRQIEYGFVVYRGENFIRFSDKMWAVPVKAFWEEGAFLMDTKKKNDSAEQNKIGVEDSAIDSFDGTADANLFFSYCHQDNEYLDNGMIDLIRAVQREYEYQYGTLNVFIDAEKIKWGDEWRDVINRSLDATNFLLPAITRKYLTSSACKEEFNEFKNALRRSSGAKILPLLWVDNEETQRIAESDPLFKDLYSLQYIKVDHLRDLNKRDHEYRNIVREITEKLHEVIIDNQAISITNDLFAEVEITGKFSEERFAEKCEKLDSVIDEMKNALNRATDDFHEINKTMNDGSMPNGSNPSALVIWARKIAESTSANVVSARKNMEVISSKWDVIYDITNSLVDLVEALPAGQEKTDNMLSLEQMLVSFKQSVPSNDVEAVFQMLNVLEILSPKLKPVVTTYRQFGDLMKQMVGSADTLLARIRMV